MELADQFERIRKYSLKLPLPKNVKESLANQLTYFQRQSLADLDRRDPPSKIKENWKSFSNAAKGTGLLEKVQADPIFWNPIALFVGDTASTSAIGSKSNSSSAASAKKTTSPLAEDSTRTGPVASAATVTPKSAAPPHRDPFFDWDVEKVFRSLLAKVIKASFEDQKDKAVLVFGLRYLIVEALRSRPGRDVAACKETWKYIWPALDHYGFLNEFRASVAIKNRLRFFLENELK